MAEQTAENFEETTFRLLLNDLKHGAEEMRVQSDPVVLGGVEWLAEVRFSKHTYIRNPSSTNNQRTHVWYNYRLSITCILPEDVKYFNCNAEVEHCRYWSGQNLLQQQNQQLPPAQGQQNAQNEASAAPNGGQQQPQPSPPASQQQANKPIHLIDRLHHRFTHNDRSLIFRVTIDPGMGNDTSSADKSMEVDLKLKLFTPIPPTRAVNLEFNEENAWTDLEIVFDNKNQNDVTNGGTSVCTIRTCKSILASCSPFFRALLYGDFKEKAVDFIELPNISCEEFKELLRHLYPNCRKPITEHNVETLLFMADRFLMTTVTEDCEKFLLFCKPDQVALEDKMVLADLYRLPNLKQQCTFDLAAEVEKCSIDQPDNNYF